MTLRIMTLSIMPLSKMKLNIMTLSIMTLSIMTLRHSKNVLECSTYYVLISVMVPRHSAK